MSKKIDVIEAGKIQDLGSKTTLWMKKLAKGVVSIASAEENRPKEIITLPSPSLNWAIGGGIIKGKTVMFYGPESAGKTLLGMMAVISDQQLDPNGIWIWFNAEFSFNRDRFIELGGDADRLLLVNSNRYTDIFDFFFHNIKEACNEGAPIRGAVIDSVRAIVYPKDGKFEESSDAQSMGGVCAAYLTSALKIWLGVQSRFGITTIFIQQVGQNLNAYSSEKWTTSGGKALDHACDYKIQVEKAEAKAGKVFSEKSEMQIGHIIKCNVKKNRMGIPNRLANMKFMYAKGIVDQDEEIYELCKTLKIIKHPEGKSNAYWQFLDDESVHGEKRMIEMFKENTELQQRAWDACMAYTEDIKGEDNDTEDTCME